ncbi:Integral membrane protein OS=Streptomyces griseorubiginosus OX=67304 GN=DWG14_06073 PE=4 SV=1 [Streptomyces griseorubiginosus]
MTLSSIGVMTGISDTRDDGAHLATDWGWFLAWLLVGACAGVGLAAILTVGAAFLVLAAVAAVLLIRKGPGRAAVGAVAGLALPAFYLAYLNRGGPGEVCRTVTGGQSCTDEYSPVPFLVVGALLLVAGLAIHAVNGRRGRA